MSEILFDLAAISKDEFGLHVDYATFPDGHTMAHVEWDKPEFKQFIYYAKQKLGGNITECAITNPPAPWVTVGIMSQLKPCRVNYLYPNNDGVELKMPELESSNKELGENCGVMYKVISDKDDGNVYINMTSDNETARTIGHHTFDFTKLSDVKIPEIPDNSNVFIHAWGMYCAMCCVALNFTKKAKSVWIACHDSDYYCCFSKDNSVEIGDQKKRILENTLPH